MLTLSMLQHGVPPLRELANAFPDRSMGAILFAIENLNTAKRRGLEPRKDVSVVEDDSAGRDDEDEKRPDLNPALDTFSSYDSGSDDQPEVEVKEDEDEWL